MTSLPGYWKINSATSDYMGDELNERYWNKLDHKAMAERTSKLVEEARELHEAMLNYENPKPDHTLQDLSDNLNDMMWEMADVFAVFRHLEYLMLDHFSLKHDMLDWLEKVLAGLAVHKMEERDKNPNWGRNINKNNEEHTETPADVCEDGAADF